MNLTSLYLQNLTVNTDFMTKSSASGNKASSFESLLFNSNKDNKPIKANNLPNKNANSKELSSNVRQKDVVKDEPKNQSTKNEESVTKKEDSKETGKTDSKKGTKNDKLNEASSNQEDTLVNDEIVKRISEALGVPAEQIKNILNQLNITAGDLSNSDNLMNFMQAVTGTENPMELLSVDNIKNMMKDVKEAVSSVLDNKDAILKSLLNSKTEFSEEIINQTDVSENSNSSNTDNKNTDTASKQTLASKNGAELNLPQDNTKNVSANNEVKSAVNLQANTNSQVQQTTNQQSEFSFNNMGKSQNLEQLNQINTFNENTAVKTFGEALSKTASAKNLNPAEVIKQIIDKFKVNTKDSLSEIKITLKPEYLGDVSLKIASEKGIVTAQFTAENQRVKEIIESNFNQLKDMLSEQGIEVAELSVNVGTQEKEMNQFNFNQEKSSRRIKNILNDSFGEEIEEVQETEDKTANYLDNGDVLETNINYTA